MTTTPQDLLAAITRAISNGASVDDRRAGRHACIVLAGALGDTGAPMASPGLGRPRIDGGQFLDLAIAKMRAFLAEQQATPTATSTSSTPPASSSTATSGAGAAATTPTAPTPSPATASPRPRQQPLRIPLVGGFAPKR